VAYVVEEGFRLFVPTEEGWEKRAVNISKLDDDHPLLRLHDTLRFKEGPVSAPPESRPCLSNIPGDPEADESLLILIQGDWMTVSANTRPLVGLDAASQPLYSVG
jgi:hypothetical protein